MLDGVMLLWFVLTAASLLFVAIDIRSTPESPVLKWGFVLLTAYTGVVGAFLYVLGCREPLPGTHERYVAARWRQVLGSTMHCVAGDGVGILAVAELLVRDVDGAAGRLHHRLSDELVAGGAPSQARHDNGAAGGRRCTGSCSRRPRSWHSCRHGGHVACRAAYGHGRSGAVAAGAG